MKKLLYFLIVVVTGLTMLSCDQSADSVLKRAEAFSAEPPRPAGQTDVVGLRVDPIPVVRAGFVGLGMRGSGSLSRFIILEGRKLNVSILGF